MEGTIFKIKRFSVHDGPGIRTAVFLKGCPLNCVWCHSPEGISSDIVLWHDRNACIGCGTCVAACPENALSQPLPETPYIEIDRSSCTLTALCVDKCPTGALQFTGYKTTAAAVVDEIKKDLAFYNTSGGGVTLTGGEPLYQPQFSRDILKACHELGIHTAIESSLFCEKETLADMADLVDLFIVDMKLFDRKQHIHFTGKPNDIIKENIRSLARLGKKMIVRIPLIPGITDTGENLEECEKFIRSAGNEIVIEQLSYNPLAGNNYKKLGLPFLL